MQEIKKDGSTGKLVEAATIMDLVPHIKKSLEDPSVAFVKVFKGKALIINPKTKGFQVGGNYGAQEEEKSLADKITEHGAPDLREKREKKKKQYAPGFIKNIKPTKLRK